MKYTIVIEWSQQDQCFIVYLPEFEQVMQPVTHGQTYEEALENAQEVLDLLINSALEEGQNLPQSKGFGAILQGI